MDFWFMCILCVIGNFIYSFIQLICGNDRDAK